jgi:hypothetical protein
MSHSNLQSIISRGQSKAHRGPMSHARRDKILTRCGTPPGEHPDYEIDHLISLCLDGRQASWNEGLSDSWRSRHSHEAFTL